MPTVMAGEHGPHLKLLDTLEDARPSAYSNVAFSPDGKTLACGDLVITPKGESVSSVKLWDVAERKVIATLQGGGLGDGGKFTVAFSPDGKTLAVAGADLTLWDLATRTEKATFKGRGTAVFSRDWRMFATVQDTTVRLWEAATGKERLSLAGHQGAIFSLAFSPDGKLLACGSGTSASNGQPAGGELKLWDLTMGRQRASLGGKVLSWVWSVAFSPDGKRLAAADVYGNVVLWEVASGKRTATLQAFNPHGQEEDINPAFSVAFSPDGKILAAGTLRGIKLWEVATGKELGGVNAPTATVWSVAFRPDGHMLASAGSKKVVGPKDSIEADPTLRVWELLPAAKTGKHEKK
jgi:WD40 repeat protein